MDERMLQQIARSVTMAKPDLNVVPDTDNFPWFIRDFQRRLQLMEARHELLLPDLRTNNESIFLLSDYGGDHPDSKFNTYSFLACAWNQAGMFNQEMATARQSFGMNNPFKEIAFKDFRYGPISRILPTYLNLLAGLVNGLLLTVVIDKKIPSMLNDGSKAARKGVSDELNSSGLGNWKPDIAERLLLVTQFSAYLVALLAGPDQKILWMTDHDAIAGSQHQRSGAVQLFANVLQRYSKHTLPVINGALPFDENDAKTLDLLSAADIAAGSVEHYMTRRELLGSELTIREEADKVLCWLSGHGLMLKKYCIIFRMTEDGISCGTLVFGRHQPDPNDKFIGISLP